MTWPASAGSGSRLTCRTASSSSRSVGPQPVRSPSRSAGPGGSGSALGGGLRRLVRLAGRRGLAAVALAAGGGQEHDGERAATSGQARADGCGHAFHRGTGAGGAANREPLRPVCGWLTPWSEQRRWPGWVYAEGEEPDYRFSLANERTLLAWLRTALALLAAGVALDQIDLAMDEHRCSSRWPPFLVLLGVVCAAASWWRWAERRAGDPPARAAALAPARPGAGARHHRDRGRRPGGRCEVGAVSDPVHGMQAGATALAWQRTGLSVAVAAAILARLTYGDLGAWALLALVVSLGSVRLGAGGEPGPVPRPGRPARGARRARPLGRRALRERRRDGPDRAGGAGRR